MKKIISTLIILFSVACCFAGRLIIETEVKSIKIRTGGLYSGREIDIEGPSYDFNNGKKWS